VFVPFVVEYCQKHRLDLELVSIGLSMLQIETIKHGNLKLGGVGRILEIGARDLLRDVLYLKVWDNCASYLNEEGILDIRSRGVFGMDLYGGQTVDPYNEKEELYKSTLDMLIDIALPSIKINSIFIAWKWH
jgi:hypothetical protein